jgi:hypothetical protein
MDDHGDPIEVRMGTFFVVLGAGTFLLFVMSDMADKVDFDYFFVALILLTIGFYLRRKKAPPPPSGRFTWFKGFWGNLRKGKAPKEKKEKK